MRIQVKKEVYSYFRSEFESRYPGFELVEGPDSYCAVWSKEICPEVYGCVALIFLRANDSFVIELGWGQSNAFPWDCDVELQKKFKLPEGRIRMGDLWKPGGAEVEWNLAPETFEGPVESWGPPPLEIVLPRIEPAVDECLQRFQKYGVRYFNKVTNVRGFGDVL